MSSPIEPFQSVAGPVDGEPGTVEVTVTDAYGATLALLATRAPDATLCPSEVARMLCKATEAETGEEGWRSMMPAVHAAVDQLLADGQIGLRWKGRQLASRTGPYRIAHGAREG